MLEEIRVLAEGDYHNRMQIDGSFAAPRYCATGTQVTAFRSNIALADMEQGAGTPAEWLK